MTTHAAAVPEAELPPLTEGPHRKRIGLISIVACLGGLLFGYDTGVSNGAEGPMAQELGLSLLQLGIVISSLIFAAAVGALIGGKISDAIGRRKTIILLAIMFFVGVMFVIFSPGFEILVAGRIILGLAVGGASTVVPVYLAELAPYEIRGSITGRNELAIVVGQFTAFVVNAILGATLGHIDGVWRIMFGICALPAIALFFGMLRMPESPRWLVEKGRYDEALAVLKTVRSEDRALAEFAQVEQVTEDEKKGNQLSFKEILSNKWLRRIVFVGIGVSVTQQLTGINSIMYYGSRVLEESGFTETAALIANTVFGLAAVIGGIFALRNMDRLDRRKTFFIGLFLTTICHCLVGIAGMLLPEGNPARPYVIAVLVTSVRAVDAVLPQYRGVGVAGGDLPARDPRPGDRHRGVLRLVRQRAPRAVRPHAPERAGTGHLLPVRDHRRHHARLPLARSARDPRPVPRIAGRGSPGRRDLQDAAPTRSLRPEPSLTLAAAGHAGTRVGTLGPHH